MYDFDRAAADAREVAEDLQRVAAATTRDASGQDPRGVVRVQVDGSGLVSAVHIVASRVQMYAPTELSVAVLEALSAVRHSPSLPADRPSQSPAAGSFRETTDARDTSTTAPTLDPRLAVADALALLADVEARIQKATGALAQLSAGNGGPGSPVTCSSSSRGVTAEATAGQITGLHFDETWFATAHPLTLGREIAQACRAAQERSVEAPPAAILRLQEDLDELRRLAPDAVTALRRFGLPS